jgi:hypothetical protein
VGDQMFATILLSISFSALINVLVTWSWAKRLDAKLDKLSTPDTD